jgi:hypothetical protein
MFVTPVMISQAGGDNIFSGLGDESPELTQCICNNYSGPIQLVRLELLNWLGVVSKDMISKY